MSAENASKASTSWENPVKTLLRSGQAAVGMTLTTASLEIAVEASQLGFDFLWAELEHCPISLEALHHIVLATRHTPAPVFARVPVNEIWMAKRVMDAGVMGVIFPFTHTAELARQAVAACRYPPLGVRGTGEGLTRNCWPKGNPWDLADEQMMVITMIESVQGVENIDEIASTPGLDVLFVGPSDLSFSLGLRGRQGDPKLLKAIDRVAEAARRHGKFLGRTAATAEEVEKYRQQGFQFFMGPTELDYLAAGARDRMLGGLGKNRR